MIELPKLSFHIAAKAKHAAFHRHAEAVVLSACNRLDLILIPLTLMVLLVIDVEVLVILKASVGSAAS